MLPLRTVPAAVEVAVEPGTGLRGPVFVPLILQLVLDAVEQVGEIVEFVPQIVPGDRLTDRDADPGEFAGEELGVRLRLRRPSAVLVEGDPVPVILPVLRQQDQGAA